MQPDETLQRILVVGPPGCGKTTLADHIGPEHGLAVVHMDDHLGKTIGPGFRTEVKTAATKLAEPEHWLMEGGLWPVLDELFPRTQVLVSLEPPLYRNVHWLLSREWRGMRKMGRGDRWKRAGSFVKRYLRWAVSYRVVDRPRLNRSLPMLPAGSKIIRAKSPAEAARRLRALVRDTAAISRTIA